jgi:hypothetical protein
LHKISFWPVFLNHLPYFAVVHISTLLVLISEIDWVNLITSACDIHGAVSDFTSIFLKIASICIPTREVIIRNDDKVWFDSTIICSFIIPNFTFIIFIITETTTYCDVCSIMIAKLSDVRWATTIL